MGRIALQRTRFLSSKRLKDIQKILYVGDICKYLGNWGLIVVLYRPNLSLGGDARIYLNSNKLPP